MCSALQIDAALRRVGFSLGSNTGDRLQYLEAACDAISGIFGTLRLSRVYETEPVGCPIDTPPFLNACVEVCTDMPPLQILRHTQAIERSLGRVRTGVYGEPRSCDIDLLYCGTEQLRTRQLTLPHPHARERRFVLCPLCDIDPALRLPGQDKSVEELLHELPDVYSVMPLNL